MPSRAWSKPCARPPSPWRRTRSSRLRTPTFIGGLLPQPLEPVPGDARVVGGVLWIVVPEVILDGAQIGAPVGQVAAAAVTQHVPPHPPKLRSLTSDSHNVVHGLADQLRLPLGDEQPGEIVFPGVEVALDGVQLVA